MVKRVITLILTLSICFTFLCACRQTQSQESGPQNDQEILPGNNSQVPNLPEPPRSYTYTFDSYEDIERALTEKGSSEYSILRDEQTDGGITYQKMLSEFSSGNIKIAIPKVSGAPMSLRNVEELSNVTLFTNELYNMPWISYHCIVNGENVVVKISYLSAIENMDDISTSRYLDILRLIAPKAPSPNNYEEYESYKIIYEKNMILNGGKSVTAMISELSARAEVYVMFPYDGMLVTVYGNNKLFTDEFWQAFNVSSN